MRDIPHSVPDLMGHPRGLAVLFFAEMWERFSFYGMRALFIFYLTKHFLFDDAHAAGLYASYGALVYLMPVFGGLVADRFIGFRRAIVLGGVLLVLGHLGMAYEGHAAYVADGEVVRDATALQVLYLSMALIIVGVGFLKPNISSIVGQLYAPEDARRDGGFTLFYMGINVGAASASLLCGYLGETFGWAYGFGAAGIGMIAGLVTFVRGQYLLGDAGLPPAASGAAIRWVYPGAVIAVLLVWWLVPHQMLIGQLLTGTSILILAGIVMFVFWRCTAYERNRMLVMLVLMTFSVLFWALFEQAGSSMNLFADRVVDRDLFGFTILPAQLQSLNPLFIILLAPLFAGLWVWLSARNLEPSTPTKFALALVLVGAGFYAMVMGIQLADTDGKVALGWLVLAYFLHTAGELCLSPVGLSMVTRLSVPRVVGLMMGVWFLSSSVASYVAGMIAGTAAVEGGAHAATTDALAAYSATFTEVTWWGIGCGVLLFLLVPLLRSRMSAPDTDQLHAPERSSALK